MFLWSPLPPALSPPQGPPLLHAAAWGETHIVSCLLAHKADVLSTDASGWSALHYAAYGGHSDTVRVLLDAGAGVL